MPNLPITKAVTPFVLYALLFIYAGIAGTYEVANSVSTINWLWDRLVKAWTVRSATKMADEKPRELQLVLSR